MNNILIIDDEPQIRKLLSRMMELEGYEVLQAADCVTAMKQLERKSIQVILCDVFLPDGNGIDMVKNIKKLYPDSEIILLTAHGNIQDGVQSIKNGAFDYIIKGDDNNKIVPLISRAMEIANNKENISVKASKNNTYTFDDIKGNSQILKQVITLGKKVAITDVSVLITGETGTGKELFAQAIHFASSRKQAKFVAINCAAFSKDLLESELFGYKAGAFTGALKDKKGLLEMADNGTIFLDEIGEMAFELQAKLLRVLECREFIKIGDLSPTKVNVRIISATNRNLKKEIDEGHFREDLFYRLSVFHISLPSLRDRKGDIAILTDYFINNFSIKLNKNIASVDIDVRKALDNGIWHGNIRELRNVIERTMIICDDRITLQDLPIELQSSIDDDSKSFSDFELSTMEKRHIARVLQYTSGNKTEAARLLKIGLTTLYRKIEEYCI